MKKLKNKDLKGFLVFCIMFVIAIYSIDQIFFYFHKERNDAEFRKDSIEATRDFKKVEKFIDSISTGLTKDIRSADMEFDTLRNIVLAGCAETTDTTEDMIIRWQLVAVGDTIKIRVEYLGGTFGLAYSILGIDGHYYGELPEETTKLIPVPMHITKLKYQAK